MPPQFHALLLSALLGLVYLSVHGVTMRRSVGFRPDNANRDNDPPLDLSADRAKRAFANYRETWPVFLAISVAVALTGRSTPVIDLASGLWLGARALYLPAYLAGFGQARSLLWVISLAALVVMLIAAWLV